MSIALARSLEPFKVKSISSEASCQGDLAQGLESGCLAMRTPLQNRSRNNRLKRKVQKIHDNNILDISLVMIIIIAEP